MLNSKQNFIKIFSFNRPIYFFRSRTLMQSSDDLPMSLLMIENGSTGTEKLIGHVRLNKVLDDENAVCLHSGMTRFHRIRFSIFALIGVYIHLISHAQINF